MKREERRQEQDSRQREHADWTPWLTLSAALAVVTDAEMARVLQDAGYHCHKGQWRKRRTMNDQLPGPEDADQMKYEDVQGDTSRSRAPRGLAGGHSQLLDARRQEALAVGGPFRRAETAVLKMYGSRLSRYEESARRRLADVRQRLAQPADGELERLLIERVVLSCVAVDLAEAQRAERWQKA